MMDESWYLARVVHGFRNGSAFGFPTANLTFEDEPKLLKGVYAAAVKYGNSNYKGMLYVGTRPTLGMSEMTFEMHILDFCCDIYGESICFKVIKYIRDEQHFSSVEKLIEQLAKDKLATEHIVNLEEYE